MIMKPEMVSSGFVCVLLSFLTSPNILVSGVYFPLDLVNVSLPTDVSLLKRPKLIDLKAVAEYKPEDAPDFEYVIVSETTPGLLVVEDSDELRLAEDFDRILDDVGSKQQSVTVSVRSGEHNFANATINLWLSGDKLSCERSKRNFCFWNGASYRILENQGPTDLGRLSSPVYSTLCHNYTLAYEVIKGQEYLKVNRMKGKPDSWMLSTTKKMKGGSQLPFLIRCTVSSSANQKSESFDREFQLTVLEETNLQIVFDFIPQPFNIIYEKEKIATGIINDPGGFKGPRLKFSLQNDTEDNFKLKCWTKIDESSSQISHYECEVTARKMIYLKSSYTAYVRIEDTSLVPENPKKFQFQNITVKPGKEIELKRESLILLPTDSEETFMLDLKYPEYVQVSRGATTGTRVVEPMLGGISPNTEVRQKIVESKIKFSNLSPGAFGVTEAGGIVYVLNRNSMKESTYRLKIAGTYPNGYRFVSTVQINVQDTKPSSKDEVCFKPTEKNNRPSCSEKRSKVDCERTCGFASGLITRNEQESPTTIGCTWRDNENPVQLSSHYQTCSPDLVTCPDRFCDPLEALLPKICPQDCTEHVIGSAFKNTDAPGISRATGACTCDHKQKCLCSVLAEKQTQRRKPKLIKNQTASPEQSEVISAVKASLSDRCGPICLVSIIGSSIILVFGILTALFMVYRRRLKKRCPNQRPLKEDMVNINYEQYVERHLDVLRPLAQNTSIKELPEYYDKKWEFPRNRLTIEESLGEGEFGRVLKAKADGICGRDGLTTVAVKTLKDNAKESELADLISEYQLLKDIDHPNVIHLLGACTKLDGPVYIIIEYAKHGSLRNYLRKHRQFNTEQFGGKEQSHNPAITPKDILTFAWQIAKGMNYLTDMKLVHRDLAARNVLVAEGLICKISDFGLTRDIYEDDTYLKRSKGRVPVKWMALESLADHIYTTKSDVWSYGIVLWELVTTGASPYPGIAGQDLFNLLKSGYRMEKPPNCSNELYQILKSCWQENPSHRPTFKSLVAKLEEMLGEGKDYLDLNPRTAENKTYFSELLNRVDDEEEEEEEETEREEEEKRSFLSGSENVSDDGVFKLRFEMFEKSNKSARQCNKCQFGKCGCVDVNLSYESGVRKPKYENERHEDTGYVQPKGEPKPVNSCLQVSDELVINTNLDTDTKKDFFDVKKI